MNSKIESSFDIKITILDSYERFFIYIMSDLKNRVGWFNKDGEKFFKMDLSHLKEDEIIKALLHIAVLMEDIKDDTIFLTNVSDSDLNANVVSHMALLSKDMQPLIKRSAIVGITGIQGALFSLYRTLTGSKARLFKDTEEAYNYLFKESN